MDCAILSSHRKVRPHGLEGGEPGERRRDARPPQGRSIEELEGCDQTTVEPGDAVIVVTPTGGGYGKV